MLLNRKRKNESNVSGNILTNGNFNIGSYWDDHSTNYTWNGLIDDVKIFNYALTAEQVKQLYNNSSAIQFGP